MATVSVGIVAHNNQKTIIRTLSSIHEYSPKRHDLEVFVIDNFSNDGTRKLLDEQIRKENNFKVIYNQKNIGFAKAHNQILKRVVSDYHVICNPDIFLISDVFTPLVEFIKRFPDIGIVSPKYCYPDGSLQHLNRRHPNVLDLILRRALSGSKEKFFKKRLESYDMRDVGYETSYDVPFLSGAFMFCRTSLLKKIGGFDEQFFLYFEDADLSRRMQNAGYRTVYFPEVSVIHSWQRMAHKSFKGSIIFALSAFRYFRKWGFNWC